MYHVFRCVYELNDKAKCLLNVAVIHMFYSELNVLFFLNACAYNVCMNYV
jgi:hypothetical protein